MSEKSSSYTNIRSTRPLRSEEKALIRALLSSRYPESRLNSALEESRVEEMLDGGMGSIRFVDKPCHIRRLGKVICRANYVDADDVPVKISINLDQDDALFEVDFWKVDFSALRRYPSVAELTMENDQDER